jgi:hypothetical protein
MGIALPERFQGTIPLPSVAELGTAIGGICDHPACDNVASALEALRFQSIA